MTYVEKVRIRRGQSFRPGPGSLRRDAVREAYSAARPVVVAGAEPTCGESHCGANAQTLEQPELGKVERRFLFINSDDADEMIDHLRYAERRQLGIVTSE